MSSIPSTPNPTPTAEQVALVDEAIVTRRSLRAFLPTPVPRSTIEEILAVASRAPSGTNTQPWKVYVLTGSAKTELSRKILAAYNDPAERDRRVLAAARERRIPVAMSMAGGYGRVIEDTVEVQFNTIVEAVASWRRWNNAAP